MPTASNARLGNIISNGRRTFTFRTFFWNDAHPVARHVARKSPANACRVGLATCQGQNWAWAISGVSSIITPKNPTISVWNPKKNRAKLGTESLIDTFSFSLDHPCLDNSARHPIAEAPKYMVHTQIVVVE